MARKAITHKRNLAFIAARAAAPGSARVATHKNTYT
jgi:hypothetical protein